MLQLNSTEHFSKGHIQQDLAQKTQNQMPLADNRLHLHEEIIGIFLLSNPFLVLPL